MGQLVASAACHLCETRARRASVPRACRCRALASVRCSRARVVLSRRRRALMRAPCSRVGVVLLRRRCALVPGAPCSCAGAVLSGPGSRDQRRLSAASGGLARATTRGRVWAETLVSACAARPAWAAHAAPPSQPLLNVSALRYSRSHHAVRAMRPGLAGRACALCVRSRLRAPV